MPTEPEPPQRPARGLSEALASLCLDYHLPLLKPPHFTPTNVSGPQIRRTNSYEVNIHVRQLKHNLDLSLATLHVLFGSYEEARSFSIDYHIMAGNIPKPTIGTLYVVVHKA